MGWTSCRTATKQSVIAEEVIPDYTSRETGKTYKTRKYSLRGNQCWHIREVYNAAGIFTGSILCLHLFESHGGELAWKTMDETAHPFYYDVPLSYLDESTLPPDVEAYAHESATAWRAAVRAQAEQKTTQNVTIKLLRAGDTVKLPPTFTPNEFKLIAKTGASWTGEAQGRVFKLGPKALAQVIR
jgi:hypothetical protein